MEKLQISLSFIEKKILEKSGFDFELTASHILGICFEGFINTRESYDFGLDGMNFESNGKITLYSIYGPKKDNWNEKGKKKVDEDANKVSSYLEQHPELKLNKWVFVVNHELDPNKILYIKSKFKDVKKVDIITPKKFINLISMKSEYVMAVARYLGLLNYEIPYEVLNTHSLVDVILQDICSLEELNTNEKKIDKINDIIQAIINHCYDKYDSYASYFNFKHLRVRFNSPLDLKILFGSLISSSRKKHFVFFENEFKEIPDTKLLKKYGIKNKELLRKTYYAKENFIVFTPTNLLPIYKLCLKIREELQNAENTKSVHSIIEEFLRLKADNQLVKSDIDK